MNIEADPNLARRDMWFARAEEVAPFLQNLMRENAGVEPRLVSAALLQARRNLVVGGKRDCLKKEVSRLLRLPQYWSITAA